LIAAQTRALGSDTDGQQRAVEAIQRAFAQASGRGAAASGTGRLTMLMSGPGPGGDETKRLQQRISELGLPNVRLVGKVTHGALGDWYGAADLFCLASRSEGCPNVVLEALACGTPIVSTEVGAIRELVSDGENGFVIGRDRLGELEEVVRKALRWSWDRTRSAERMDQWGWTRCADEVLETYRAVLAEEPPP
jgi:glycosyltransferase involved in cell wall biosynthesis